MDIICFSHIRWNFVYQRPQHLLNRFAICHRVFVIEEPIFETSSSDFHEVTMVDPNRNLWVVNLHISQNACATKTNASLKELLDSMMHEHSITNYISWYYTPMALGYSDHLKPLITIYDCMDELSAFKFAPKSLGDWERRLFSQADVVFTGGVQFIQGKEEVTSQYTSFPQQY